MILKTKVLLSTLFIFLLVNLSFAQENKVYHSYDDAYYAVKENSKMKGFRAIEKKYKHCKNLSSSSIRNVEEIPNQFTGKMDVFITWDYKYSGCYIGYHKYEGSAIVKSSISKVSNNRYKTYEKGVEILYWESEK